MDTIVFFVSGVIYHRNQWYIIKDSLISIYIRLLFIKLEFVLFFFEYSNKIMQERNNKIHNEKFDRYIYI